MSNTNNNYPLMPTPEEFLLETPLYKRFKNDKVLELRDFTDPLDFYCSECKKHSVFNRSDKTPSQIMAQVVTPSGAYRSLPRNGSDTAFLFSLQFKCSRSPNHEAVFYFREDDFSVYKIGEFPPRAEAFSNDIQVYKKILGEEYLSLQLAQELYSQGIGAGAFVYLRRIFENVIIEQVANRKYENLEDWDFQVWKKQNSRMKEKLNDLLDALPDFINHHELFNVLSVGVHSLDENTCLQYFSTIQKAIIEILDTEILKEKEAETRRLLGKDVSKINRDIRK